MVVGPVTGVDFVTVATSDHDAACRFYEETLGLERSKSWGDHPATEFETGSLTIAVIDWRGFGRDNQPNANPIVLQVGDVPAAKAELESRGVEFQTDIIDSGTCHQAYFADPDGNALGIHHVYGDRG
jgi:catechol 2,3-dioxygenase-like lactoylglutathione lyase family enzyme